MERSYKECTDTEMLHQQLVCKQDNYPTVTEPNRTLLLLDDSPQVLRLLQRTLENEGYEIHAFSRPYDALVMLDSAPVGVIIADQCMPQMEGTEFLRRAKLKQPGVVPISLSSYWQPGKKAGNRVRNPVWRYMSKPFSSQELKINVAEAFTRYNRSDNYRDWQPGRSWA